MKDIAIVSLVALGLIAFGLLLTTGNFNFEPAEQVQQDVVIPTPTGYVNDTSNILDPEVKSSLEELLVEFEKTGRGEIAVLTIPTTKPYTIEQYGIELGDEWKVGDSEEDNGVILIVATEDRQVRIEVGHGAEAYITDTRAGHILDQAVVPELRTGDWNSGITNGVELIIGQMTNE